MPIDLNRADWPGAATEPAAKTLDHPAAIEKVGVPANGAKVFARNPPSKISENFPQPPLASASPLNSDGQPPKRRPGRPPGHPKAPGSGRLKALAGPVRPLSPGEMREMFAHPVASFLLAALEGKPIRTRDIDNKVIYRVASVSQRLSIALRLTDKIMPTLEKAEVSAAILTADAGGGDGPEDMQDLVRRYAFVIASAKRQAASGAGALAPSGAGAPAIEHEPEPEPEPAPRRIERGADGNYREVGAPLPDWEPPEAEPPEPEQHRGRAALERIAQREQSRYTRPEDFVDFAEQNLGGAKPRVRSGGGNW